MITKKIKSKTLKKNKKLSKTKIKKGGSFLNKYIGKTAKLQGNRSGAISENNNSFNEKNSKNIGNTAKLQGNRSGAISENNNSFNGKKKSLNEKKSKLTTATLISLINQLKGHPNVIGKINNVRKKLYRWYIAIPVIRKISYQSFGNWVDYIYQGTEEEAQKIFAKLSLIEHNDNVPNVELKKSFKDYLALGGNIDEENNKDINKQIEEYLKNRCKISQRGSELMDGYYLLDELITYNDIIEYMEDNGHYIESLKEIRDSNKEYTNINNSGGILVMDNLAELNYDTIYDSDNNPLKPLNE